MIALDSSVLLDILIDDPRHSASSERCIADALAHNEVVVCEVVVAEVQAMLDTSTSLVEVLAGTGIRFDAISDTAAMRAGHMNKRFRSRGGRRERAVPDFLIGAHALLQCKGLITRDAGFYRDYFKGLKVITPEPVS